MSEDGEIGVYEYVYEESPFPGALVPYSYAYSYTRISPGCTKRMQVNQSSSDV